MYIHSLRVALSKEEVVEGTAKWVKWWIEERKNKLREQISSTMSVNPLMLPIIFEFHGLQNFDELSDLLVGSHLMVGHSTGFGKLIDEKILPNVFGTTKLDADFRESTEPYHESCFDEIDHIIPRDGSEPDFLSLKSSKWTIQLTMAVQLNAAFKEIIDSHSDTFRKIIVGVFYGKKENLTDKYDILRGINRGRNHNVIDITNNVDVVAGREFWSWLNYGEQQTQDWILEGIMKAIKDENVRAECKTLLEGFNKKIRAEYSKFIDTNGNIKWEELLKEISG